MWGGGVNGGVGGGIRKQVGRSRYPLLPSSQVTVVLADAFPFFFLLLPSLCSSIPCLPPPSTPPSLLVCAPPQLSLPPLLPPSLLTFPVFFILDCSLPSFTFFLLLYSHLPITPSLGSIIPVCHTRSSPTCLPPTLISMDVPSHLDGKAQTSLCNGIYHGPSIRTNGIPNDAAVWFLASLVYWVLYSFCLFCPCSPAAFCLLLLLLLYVPVIRFPFLLLWFSCVLFGS